MLNKHKVGFFLLALSTMICIALASALMAQGKSSVSLTLFILAVFGIGGGFIARKRILKRSGS